MKRLFTSLDRQCGYNTCRDKAVAIYQGKADISMCLPFLKEKTLAISWEYA